MVKKILKRVIPDILLSVLIKIYSQILYTLKRIRYFGYSRSCPICHHTYRQFLPFGYVKRKDALCLTCGSLERHRLLWIFLHRETDLFNPPIKKLLHVAPKKCFKEALDNLEEIDYLTADLHDPDVMVQLDITDIPFPDETFDVILCNHVLEHVPDDRKAMLEFNRVLKPGGWAVLQVPISGKKTKEDLNETDPVKRQQRFGHPDHVRYYGIDYVDRLREANFIVECIPTHEIVNRREISKMGIMENEEIFYCKKPHT